MSQYQELAEHNHILLWQIQNEPLQQYSGRCGKEKANVQLVIERLRNRKAAKRMSNLHGCLLSHLDIQSARC